MTSHEILIEVAAKHNIAVEDLMDKKRFKPFVAARKEAMILMRQHKKSVGSIADLFDCDLTTVVYHTVPEFAESKRRKMRLRDRRRVKSRPVVISNEVYRLVKDYAAVQEIPIDVAASELLRNAVGAA